jgi:hypothetical protein
MLAEVATEEAKGRMADKEIEAARSVIKIAR